MLQENRVLFLAPHTDDVELGCGGTIARYIEEGLKIYIAVFSTAEESLPEGLAKDTLRNEFLNSTNGLLKIPLEQLFIHNYPVRKLSYHRQDVLEDLVRIKRTIQPNMVFVPSGNDMHQDHQTLHNEALRAFKEVTMFGYELPWNHINFSAQAFIVLKEHHIKKKWEMMQQYKTQLDLQRTYFSYEFIESLARVRGVQVKEDFAEAFEVIRAKV